MASKQREQLTGQASDVSCELNHGDLESEADTEEGDVLLARPLDRRDHALSTAKTESSGHEDTPAKEHKPVRVENDGNNVLGGADGLPGSMELLWSLVLRLGLEIRRLDPLSNSTRSACA